MKDTTIITLWNRTIEIDKKLYETAMSKLKIYDIEELENDTVMYLGHKRRENFLDTINRASISEITRAAESALKGRLELL